MCVCGHSYLSTNEWNWFVLKKKHATVCHRKDNIFCCVATANATSSAVLSPSLKKGQYDSVTNYNYNLSYSSYVSNREAMYV